MCHDLLCGRVKMWYRMVLLNFEEKGRIQLSGFIRSSPVEAFWRRCDESDKLTSSRGMYRHSSSRDLVLHSTGMH